VLICGKELCESSSKVLYLCCKKKKLEKNNFLTGFGLNAGCHQGESIDIKEMLVYFGICHIILM